MKNGKRILYHFLGWMVYLLIIALSADEVDRDFIFKNLSSTVPGMVVFYFNIGWVFPRFLEPKPNYFAVIFLTLLGCVMTTGLRVAFSAVFPHELPPFDRIMFWVQFRFNILFACISFAYWFAGKNYRDKKRWAQLEKEMADARLTYLKNQVNPHFLYNSLSLLYAKTLPLSAEVSDLVGKISDILRYSLEEPADNGLVPLDKEITHIRNYLDIQQLRFNNTLNIVFEVTGDAANYRILPMLLITFVENACKHGRLNDANNPVTIRLAVMNDEISFSLKNTKATGSKERSSGIGLANVRSRLDLQYPQSHMLVIKDEAQLYAVDLTIKTR